MVLHCSWHPRIAANLEHLGEDLLCNGSHKQLSVAKGYAVRHMEHVVWQLCACEDKAQPGL